MSFIIPYGYSQGHFTAPNRYIFSQGYSLYFFLIFVHLWWFGGWGFWGCCLGLDFCGWGFQLMAFEACGLGPFGFFKQE